jgi:predicted Zn-dependent protease
MVLLSNIGNSQINFDKYTTLMSKGPIPEDFTKETYKKLADDLKKDRSDLTNSQEKVFIEGTNYAIDEILHSGLVIYGDDISTYVSEIADKLLQNEGDLRSKLRFYTIKSNAANAFSTDQGIVFVTTGLIAQLTSEAQLAYVLAHEIAHYTEKHVVETFDWKTQNGRQNDRIERLSQYSKDKEFEADKIGIHMYNDAGYSVDEIFSTFDVLMYSYLPFDEIEFPFTYFNSSQIFVPSSLFPTKKYEIKAEEDYDDENSSHPNIKKRKEASEKEIGTISTWQNATQFLGIERFNQVRNIARFESVRSDIIDASYGNAMYSVFLLEKDFPNSIYLKRMKAQIWLNMMLYKSENMSAKMLDKTSEYEGESAAIHFFLKKLNREGMMTMALRQIHDLHIANLNDSEISAIYTRFVKEVSNDDKFKIESFSKKSFSEAANDFLMSQSDTNKIVLKDTIVKSTSKYDRIKNKKNADAPENFDSTKFYLYGINDILIDSEFINQHDQFKKIKADEDKEIEKYNSLSNAEQKALDKKKVANEYSIGLKEIIVVEPMVISYKKGNVDNVKSEKLEKDFASAIESSAKSAGVTTYSIDSRSLINKGTQGFNERSLLISLLNQLAAEDNVNIFPVDFQLLNEIKNNYGTSKVMFSLVEHDYSPNITGMGVFSSLLLYPILFVYVPVGILTGNNTQMNVLILDLENGVIENGINYYFKDSPKKLQLGAHMYDIFKKLNTEPIN